MSVRPALPAMLILAALLAPAPARADLGSFRLIEAQPTKKGAKVLIAYKNEWGTPQDTEANAEVQLFGHTTKPAVGNAGHSEDRSMPLGTVRMLGTGQLSLEVDYAKHGLKPGQLLCMSGAWVKSEHRWGESWAGLARNAGSVTLPEVKGAQKNCLLVVPHRPAWLQGLRRPLAPAYRPALRAPWAPRR